MKLTLLIGCFALGTAGWIPAEAVAPHGLDISVHTDKPVGECRRFWTIRVLTDQSDFTKPGFLDTFKASHPFTRSINCVRTLGGRTDHLNEWFKGMNPDGSIKADFSELMPQSSGVSAGH